MLSARLVADCCPSMAQNTDKVCLNDRDASGLHRTDRNTEAVLYATASGVVSIIRLGSCGNYFFYQGIQRLTESTCTLKIYLGFTYERVQPVTR
jgi:hypothetical protein